MATLSSGAHDDRIARALARGDNWDWAHTEDTKYAQAHLYHEMRAILSEAAPAGTVADADDVKAWIDHTLTLPMYQNSISEYGQGVVETLRTVRKLLDGGTHADTPRRPGSDGRGAVVSENEVENVEAAEALPSGQWVQDATGHPYCLIDTHMGFPQRMAMYKRTLTNLSTLAYPLHLADFVGDCEHKWGTHELGQCVRCGQVVAEPRPVYFGAEAMTVFRAAAEANARRDCTCYETDPKTWTRYGSAVEPGSTLAPNPDCPVHFPTGKGIA